MVPPGTVYRQIVCCREHKICFGRHKANQTLENFYYIALVVESKSYERSDVFLQRELLKSILSQNVFIVKLHHAPAGICMP